MHPDCFTCLFSSNRFRFGTILHPSLLMHSIHPSNHYHQHHHPHHYSQERVYTFPFLYPTTITNNPLPPILPLLPPPLLPRTSPNLLNINRDSLVLHLLGIGPIILNYGFLDYPVF